ncbi:SRPBCC family protein [Microlunatus speluncae]|uniref:SRPBCC family protein n=1 Tax=Microlunatus speluncae TaxID=2594267 RepID=UPI0012661705|nr:SRPBCC family protein [Microlunatus speluncae]
MKIERELIIDAPVDVVWSVMSDVERWPEMTASMTSVRLLDGELRLGARAEVVQPKLPKAIWTVTRWDEGRRFDWTARSAGLTTVGIHGVEATTGGTRAYIGAEQTGFLAPLLALLIGKLSEGYLDLEIAGFRDRSLAIR